MAYQLTRRIVAVLLGFTLVVPAAHSQEGGLRDYVQIGSRIARSSTADTLEVRLIISPEIRLYANPKTALVVFSGPAPSSMSVPAPSHFRTADGTVQEVYGGAVTLTANFPKGSIACGQQVIAALMTQGCTANLCFPPEKINVSTKQTVC